MRLSYATKYYLLILQNDVAIKRPKSKSPPRLVLESPSSESIRGHILADDTTITFIVDDVYSAIMNLMAAYYAWGLNFPRCYQVLGFINIHVLAETSYIRKTTNFVKLEKMLSDGH